MKLTLDLTFLKEISDNDQAFINDVLRTFLEEMPKDIAQMSQALDIQDYVSVGKMAHKTKSTLQTLGLHDLKQLAFTIEQTSKQTPIHPELATWTKNFINYIQQVYPNVSASLIN